MTGLKHRSPGNTLIRLPTESGKALTEVQNNYCQSCRKP